MRNISCSISFSSQFRVIFRKFRFFQTLYLPAELVLSESLQAVHLLPLPSGPLHEKRSNLKIFNPTQNVPELFIPVTTQFRPYKKDLCRKEGKVVTSVQGTKFNSLPRYSYLNQDILKNIMNSSFSSNLHSVVHPVFSIILVQNSQRGKELNKFCPPNSSDDLSLLFCLKHEILYRYLMLQYCRGNNKFNKLKWNVTFF